ncbi:MAG: hypothetical protein LBV72_07275 [Tannerella sp.]|nr:hypothetical protein [Tannerella sp.]
MDSNVIKQNLEQIADMLLLNGTLTECSGLVHGKIGIAVFFFHYAQYTDNMLYADYAMDLIGEMLNQMHVNSPADYERGIAGIGVGLDYMIRNNFLDVEDDICEDFDYRMYRAIMHDPWQDFSQYKGLTGYGRYWMTRLRYQAPSAQARVCLLHIVKLIEENLSDIPEENQTDVYCFLYDLQKIAGLELCSGLLEQCGREWGIQSLAVERSFPRLNDSAIDNVIRSYQYCLYFNAALQDEMEIALKQIPDLDMEKSPAGTGLLNGYAGEGLLRLTALGQTNKSWMLLL